MADQSSDSPKETQNSPWTIRILIVALVVVGFMGWDEVKSRNIVAIYQGKAVIQVSQRMVANSLDSRDHASDLDYYLRKLNTIAVSLANTELMKQVINDHDLLNNSAFTGPDPSSVSMERLARSLVSRTRARLREGTELISISVSNRDQDLAKNLVNWVAHGFIKQHSRRRLNMNGIANGALTNEAERLKIRLRNAEVALIDFRRSSKLFVSLEERQSMLGSRVASWTQSKDHLVGVFARLEADLSLVKSFGDEPSASQFEQVPSIWNSEEVQRYRKLLTEVEMKVEELTFRHKEPHPKVGSEKSKLKWAEARLFESMKKQANGLDAEYQRLQKERDLVMRQLTEAELESLDLSEMAVEYSVLDREVQGTKALYFSVLNRIKEIDLTTGLMDEVITIIEPASGARNINGSGRPRLWGSGLTGLVLALAGVYFFDHFPFRVKRKS